MSERRNPRRVKINEHWYDVREGWNGTLELSKSMNISWSVEYTAREPYMNCTNLFHVYNTSGSQVGEFHTGNRTYSGCVRDFEA
jgi:hypothetical protein